LRGRPIKGVAIKEACRKHGFSEASYYLWRSKYGGMDVSDAKRLFAPAAGKGGGHSEADEQATSDVTFPAQVVPIVPATNA
jgi:Transposase